MGFRDEYCFVGMPDEITVGSSPTPDTPQPFLDGIGGDQVDEELVWIQARLGNSGIIYVADESAYCVAGSAVELGPGDTFVGPAVQTWYVDGNTADDSAVCRGMSKRPEGGK